MPSNPQDLTSEGVLTRHIPTYTDPFILLIKACMLFGRVTDYNTRVNLRSNRSSSSHQNTASYQDERPSTAPSGSTAEVQYGVYRGDPRMVPGFRALDRLVAVDFLANLPVGLKSCLGVQPPVPPMHYQANSGGDAAPSLDIDGTSLDTDLYLVHLIPHA